MEEGRPRAPREMEPGVRLEASTVRPGTGRSARAFFRSDALAYDAAHYGAGVRSFMSVRQEAVLALVDGLGLPPGAPVLDAGCGPGRLLAPLAARGLAAVGVDTSSAMLGLAAERLGRDTGPSALLLGSLEALPFADASFALVCSTGVIEYLPDDHRALAEMHRVLRPGGHLVLPVTNALSPVGWLDGLVEALKRRPGVLSAFNAWWRRRGHAAVRARHFAVRRHRPSALRRTLVEEGFVLRQSRYFYLIPWPHPLDRLLPRTTARIGRRLERLADSPLGPLAEGYIALSQKRARAPHGGGGSDG